MIYKKEDKERTNVGENIRAFLLRSIWDRQAGPIAAAMEKFGMTRQGVHRYMNQLIDEGLVNPQGTTRNAVYWLPELHRKSMMFELAELEEHHVWEELVKESVAGLPEDDVGICHYGFTEIVNNAIDHSMGQKVRVGVYRNAVSICFTINDDGIGIFKKIGDAMGLKPEEAILELSKGKLTTDPKRHSGEGIFFTSRVFDRFQLSSGIYAFVHERRTQDWLIECEHTITDGTHVFLELVVPSGRNTQQTFDEFSSGPDDYKFSKTRVPLMLAQFGNSNLNSRSQAKRVLSRVERFDEVCLDFAGVEAVGQAFADEIFRVFKLEKPEIDLLPINANPQVMKMIRRAQSGLEAT